MTEMRQSDAEMRQSDSKMHKSDSKMRRRDIAFYFIAINRQYF